MIPGMPDIPDFKGLVSSGTTALIGAGGAFAINRVFGNQWGIFNQFGVPILLADTVHSVKHYNTSQVAQAPVERGTFTSYNKVADPYTATVTMIVGSGSAARRGAFIAQLEALSRSTLLFHVITPEYVHINSAIVGYDYAREPNSGARMIIANIHLQEVREGSVERVLVQTENPEDMPAVDHGEQQPETPSESTLNRIVTSEDGLVNTVRGLMDEAYIRFTGGGL